MRTQCIADRGTYTSKRVGSNFVYKSWNILPLRDVRLSAKIIYSPTKPADYTQAIQSYQKPLQFFMQSFAVVLST